MKLSELTGAAAKVKDLVVTSYAAYRTAVNKDDLSTAISDAKVPDAQVWEKDGALIVILAERHESMDGDVQSGALGVAKAVLAIPKVKVAVEEPMTLGGTLISNVGWGRPLTPDHNAGNLFSKEPAAQGSISHQIYVQQVGSALVTTKRYAAERGAKPRYNNPKINADMAELLIENTNAGEISVFPVGPDHLRTAYDPQTLGAHLKAAGWQLLENK